MKAQYIILIIMLVELLYFFIKAQIMEEYRKNPLPKEVSDIYEKERYQTYLSYVKENRKLSFLSKIISFILSIIFLLSPVFIWIEEVCGNQVYLIFYCTYLIYTCIEMIFSYFISSYKTFKIEEKFGLNKKDKKEFHREFLLSFISETVMDLILFTFLIYVGEHLVIWTYNFSLTFIQLLLIAIIVCIFFAILVLLLSIVSIFILKKQYIFTPLQDENLLEKIHILQKDSKKKVKHINVYNESKKSTSKNAFLLRLLWYREFGIADNFILHNEEEELLAVLSHEVGHLKHKKTGLEYIRYLVFVCMFLLFVFALSNVVYVECLLSYIKDSFHIIYSNYYLYVLFITVLLKPFFFIFQIFNNYLIRKEEYEADRNAVENGYGDALIKTFKKLSEDELINVNPSPIIEFLEYDHPGMYHRIKAIKEYQEKMKI